MHDQEALRELARARTRDALRRSPSFMSLDVAEQKSLFQDLYSANYRDLAQSYGNDRSLPSQQQVARAMAGNRQTTAGDLIDDSRHENRRIEQAGELAGDFIDEVDFPGFVRDLLKGVFDANLEVTLQQMSSFQELLKTATESVSKFVNAIDDTSAFGYLAESEPDDFSIDFSDDETDEAGKPGGSADGCVWRAGGYWRQRGQVADHGRQDRHGERAESALTRSHPHGCDSPRGRARQRQGIGPVRHKGEREDRQEGQGRAPRPAVDQHRRQCQHRAHQQAVRRRERRSYPQPAEIENQPVFGQERGIDGARREGCR